MPRRRDLAPALLALVAACRATGAVDAVAPRAAPVLVPSSCASATRSPAPAPASEPAPFDEERLAAERARWLAGVDLGSIPRASNAEGAPSVASRPDPGRVTWTCEQLARQAWGEAPGVSPPGRRVQTLPGTLRDVPTARVQAPATLEVAFEPAVPLVAARLLYGVRVAGERFTLPHLLAATELVRGGEPGHGAVLSVPLADLLSPARDVAELVRRGRGDVVWRLETTAAVAGTPASIDGVTSVRCDPAPCGAASSFIPLPTVQVGPRVGPVSETGASVTFTTDVPTRALVLVQGARGSVRRIPSSEAARRHEVRVEGLTAGERYRYQALVVDRRGEVGRSASAVLRTAPNGLGPVSFAMIGAAVPDAEGIRAGAPAASLALATELMARAAAEDLDFAVAIGIPGAVPTTSPAAFRGAIDAWTSRLSPYAARMPIYQVLGDRDRVVEAWQAGWAIARTDEGSAEALLGARVVNPANGPAAAPGGPPLEKVSFSFDRGPVHVAVLHTGYWWRSHPDRSDHPRAALGGRSGGLRPDDLAWLDADLSAAERRGARWTFVVTAVPAFPQSSLVGEAMFWGGVAPEVLERRAAFLQLLAAHSVAALVAAGEPGYSRTRVHEGLVPGLTRPLWQIVTGGAAPIPAARSRDLPWGNDVERFDLREHAVTFTVDADRVVVTAAALDGELVDRFEIDAGTG